MADNSLELKKLRELLGSLPSQSKVSPEEVIDALSYKADTPSDIMSRLKTLSGDMLMEKYNISPEKNIEKTYSKAFKKLFPDSDITPVFDDPVKYNAVAQINPELKTLQVNPAKIPSHQRAVQNAFHEGLHIDDVLKRNHEALEYFKSSPEKRKLLSKLYNIPEGKIEAYLDDPAFKIKDILVGHHGGDYIKGAEPTAISRILSNEPLADIDNKIAKLAKTKGDDAILDLSKAIKTTSKATKGTSKAAKTALKGLKMTSKAIPGIGTLLGLGIAAATGDLNAAVPIYAEMGKSGPNEDDLESIIENPEKSLKLKEDEYKKIAELIKNKKAEEEDEDE